MTTPAYDLVIRNGTVATASDTFAADVAIAGEAIAAIGKDLGPGKTEIDARGKYVLPGGVDAHAHIEQLSANGIMTSDTFETGTASALHGGTTSVVCFASQHRGMSVKMVVEDYHVLAKRGSMVDYAMHIIVSDPTETVITEELPPLIRAGHASIKVFMTYDLINVSDEQLLDVLLCARAHHALVCVHAETNGMISWMAKRLVAKGYVAPKFHAISHPRVSEAEAINRLVACAELIDQPVIVYHVATAEGAAAIRAARGRGLKVFGETCTQYLFLTAQDLDKPGLDGAKWICSPPLRTAADQEALWQALRLGDLQFVSSDHAPYALDATGKFKAGPNPNFKQIANGMPGLELRLPMLFDAIVHKGRGTLQQFVAWTATEPAKMYGLHPKKGTIAIGADADICIWDPNRRVMVSDAGVHDATKYTPYAGRTIEGWPTTVLLRGTIVQQDGKVTAKPGSGKFMPRTAGEAAKPAGRLSPEFDPARNFGATLY
jgi:dihydropyrimidinase